MSFSGIDLNKEFQTNTDSMNSMQFLSYPFNPFGYQPFPPLIGQAFGYPFNASIGQMQGFPQNYNSGEVMPLMPALRANSSEPTLPSMTIAPLPKSGSDERKMYYFCRFCSSYESEDVNDFKFHLTTHSAKGRPFVCQVCSKSYGFRSLWRNHIVVHMTVKGKGKTKLSTEQDSHSDSKQSEESEENRFKCKKCDHICDPTEDLRHQTKLGSNSLKFKHSDSEYQTQTKTNLQRQESTHLRDRPFACVECNSTFSQSGSLKGHLVKVHKIEDFLFSCLYCKEFEAKNFGSLKTHITNIHKKESFGYKIVKLS